jgi:hypothetical protein
MRIFQDDCVSVTKYAQMIGKSRRTVQRYISIGMPAVKGTRECIHLPTVEKWWAKKAESFVALNENTPQPKNTAPAAHMNGGSNG